MAFGRWFSSLGVVILLVLVPALAGGDVARAEAPALPPAPDGLPRPGRVQLSLEQRAAFADGRVGAPMPAPSDLPVAAPEHPLVGVAFGPGSQVNSNSGIVVQQAFPAVAVDPSGNVYGIWEDSRYGGNRRDPFFATLPAGSAVWSAADQVNTGTPLGQVSVAPSLAADASGNLHAAWQDFRNGHWDVYFARAVAGVWGAAVKVNDDAGSANATVPDIAVDSAGNVHVVWVDSRLGDADVYYGRLASGAGAFSANVRLNTDGSTLAQENPAIAVDGAGDAYVVWQDMYSGKSDIRFAKRSASNGVWTVNPDPINVGSGVWPCYYPDIALDGAGNAYAVWEDWRNTSGGTRHSDVYSARLPAGTLTWSANLRVNDGTGATDEAFPAVAADSSGNAFAAWEDARHGGKNLYAARLSSGATAWGVSVLVSDEVDTVDMQGRPSLVADASAGIHALWHDWRGGNWDIYYARLAAGETAWSANLKASSEELSGAWAAQDYPSVALDGAGNLHAVWWDYREGTSLVWYAQRPAGSSTWAGERQVAAMQHSPTFFTQGAPALAAASNGRVHVVFETLSAACLVCDAAYNTGLAAFDAPVEVRDAAPAVFSVWRDVPPGLVADRTSAFHAAWMERGSARGGSAGAINLYSAKGAGAPIAWGANRKLNDNSVEAERYSPALGADNLGNLHAAWQDDRDGGENAIYYARLGAGGTAWGANVRVSDTFSGTQQYPSLAVGVRGNVHIVWQDSRRGNHDVYYSVSTGGTAAWSANVRVNDDTSTANQYFPGLAADGYGAIHAVWEDWRSGHADIQYARLPMGGAWGANQRVSDAAVTTEKGPARVVASFWGGVYALWADWRAGASNPDIYLGESPVTAPALDENCYGAYVARP